MAKMMHRRGSTITEPPSFASDLALVSPRMASRLVTPHIARTLSSASHRRSRYSMQRCRTEHKGRPVPLPIVSERYKAMQAVVDDKGPGLPFWTTKNDILFSGLTRKSQPASPHTEAAASQQEAREPIPSFAALASHRFVRTQADQDPHAIPF
ncbi:uncharacterized protein BDZ83DRAFT_650017 [Colletotrichum acutatum]|uniref:Uncharacterized protein n=1 Tax=Glomerella acutata TaxID=27357 RepID=A0AAD8UN74_GLOAC|nr:uncharacterized protein BDZ83DRAFT_650017 [Colletotrichum acutatum]KAK1726936.1 hypothetical protein BDZ83DRAFT_650017 [Colletotrichum acutatum]